MRTRNLDEATAAVTKVYCPHTTEIIGRKHALDIILDVERNKHVPLIRLSFNVPIKVDAQDFSHLFLMMHCSNGSACARQGTAMAEWRQGQTVPFSADIETRLRFDGAFVQRSIRLDLDKLESACARWLGYPLKQRLRFALQPFSPTMEAVWQRALAVLWSSEDHGFPLAEATRMAFDDFLLSILLHNHPHNYSEEMTSAVPTPVPGLVRRAERLMVDKSDAPITVSAVATELGVSIRTLQAGFRQWRSDTPSNVLRRIRLHRVHDELARPGKSTSVTNAATRWGFAHLGRFSAQYRAVFNEVPSETLRRGRNMSVR
jgi:AraC-like DNA-binding protein